jgi:hypothetical protein
MLYFMGAKWARGSEKSPLDFLDYFGADPIPFGREGEESRNELHCAFRLV